MKKLLIISISVMIILVLASSVMAKTVKLELAPNEGSGSPTPYETGLGEVILNNPSGAVNLVVQVNLKGAIDGETYTVWIQAKDKDDHWVVLSDTQYKSSGWYMLGELIANKVGNGTFHANLKLAYSGELSKIIVALDTQVYLKINYLSEEGEIEIK